MDQVVRLKTSTFGRLELATDAFGNAQLTLANISNEVELMLTPEELGIVLTSFGNAISQARRAEQKMKEKKMLTREKKRGHKEGKI